MMKLKRTFTPLLPERAKQLYRTLDKASRSLRRNIKESGHFRQYPKILIAVYNGANYN